MEVDDIRFKIAASRRVIPRADAFGTTPLELLDYANRPVVNYIGAVATTGEVVSRA